MTPIDHASNEPRVERAPTARSIRSASWALLASALVTLCLGAAWLWMAKQREEGYAYRVVSYPEAYVPSEVPALEAAHFAGEQLTLELEGAAELAHRFEVPIGLAEHALPDSGEAFRTSRGPGGPPIVASASILRAEGRRCSLKDHVAELDDYPPAHVAAVRAQLAQAGLPVTGATLERFQALFLWLHGKLAAHAGPPPRDYQTIAAYDQYARALRGEMKLFCANYAEILTLFATVAGFSVRVVDAAGAITGTPFSAHTFVELYVPELSRFVYTDLTLSLFAVRLGANGPPLDSAQIVQIQQMGGRDALRVEIVRDGALVEVNERQGPERLSVFLNPNAVFVFHQRYRDRFSPIHRALRYLFADEPAYALNADGARFRTRMRVQVGLCVAALVTLALFAYVVRARLRSR